MALDVRRGLVSDEGVRRYGVVLNSNRSVDGSATSDLRRRMASERGDIGLFNFGGTVEELKARCNADTNLDPPVTPYFKSGWVDQARELLLRKQTQGSWD